MYIYNKHGHQHVKKTRQHTSPTEALLFILALASSKVRANCPCPWTAACISGVLPLFSAWSLPTNQPGDQPYLKKNNKTALGKKRKRGGGSGSPKHPLPQTPTFFMCFVCLKTWVSGANTSFFSRGFTSYPKKRVLGVRETLAFWGVTGLLDVPLRQKLIHLLVASTKIRSPLLEVPFEGNWLGNPGERAILCVWFLVLEGILLTV